MSVHIVAVTEPEDATTLDLLQAASHDPEVLAWTPLQPDLDRAGARARLTLLLDRGTPWTIFDGGHAVGMVASFPTRSGSGALELGYWLLAGARGRGVMRLALTEVVAHLSSKPIELAIGAGNVPSQRLAAAAGFETTGRTVEIAGNVLGLWRREPGTATDGGPGASSGTSRTS